MLNTVARRITTYQMFGPSPCSSTRVSDAGFPDVAEGLGRPSTTGGSLGLSSHPSVSRRTSASIHAAVLMRSESVTSSSHPGFHQASSLNGDEVPAVPTFDPEPTPKADSSAPGSPHGGAPSPATDNSGRPAADASTVSRLGSGGDLSSDARTAQFASMAERSDLRGLEAAMGSASGAEVGVGKSMNKDVNGGMNICMRRGRYGRTAFAGI